MILMADNKGKWACAHGPAIANRSLRAVRSEPIRCHKPIYSHYYYYYYFYRYYYYYYYYFYYYYYPSIKWKPRKESANIEPLSLSTAIPQSYAPLQAGAFLAIYDSTSAPVFF